MNRKDFLKVLPAGAVLHLVDKKEIQEEVLIPYVSLERMKIDHVVPWGNWDRSLGEDTYLKEYHELTREGDIGKTVLICQNPKFPPSQAYVLTKSTFYKYDVIVDDPVWLDIIRQKLPLIMVCDV